VKLPGLLIVVAVLCSPPSGFSLSSPIGWWKLDEGSGSTVADASGNGHAGTFDAGPTWTSGAISNAVQFSIYKRVYVAPWSAFNVTNSISVAVWIRLTNTWEGVAGDTDVVRNDFYYKGWELTYNDLRQVGFRMTAVNGNSIVSGRLMPTNLWTHIAATFDGTTAKLYMNGMLINSVVWTGVRVASTNAVAFGQLPGALDDVRVYTQALTEAEVVQVYAAGDTDLDRLADVDEAGYSASTLLADTDGDGFDDGVEVMAGSDPNNAGSTPNVTGNLAGWWKLNETNGTSAADSSGNSNTGTLLNGPTWATGLMAGGLDYDGTNDGVRVSNNTSLGIRTNVTLSGWIFSRGTNGEQTVTEKSGAYYLNLRDGLARFYFFGMSPAGYHETSIPLVTGVWTHVAATYNGTNAVVYVNGSPLRTVSASGIGDTSSDNLGIGYNTSVDIRYVNGKLDDVRVIGRALSAGEINALAWADTDGDGLPDAQEARLGTNPNVADTDGDGMPDGWEIRNGYDPLSSGDASLDTDGDGLTNLQEYQQGTNPASADTDGDGMSDLFETQYLLSPLSNTDAACKPKYW